MRVAKCVAILVMLVVLVGCGDSRDVDVEIHVEQGGEGGVLVPPTRTPSVSQPTATAQQGAEPTTTEQGGAAPEPTAQELAPPPTEAPTQVPSPLPPTESPTEAPPAPAAADEPFTFDPGAWQESLTSLGSFRQRVSLDFAADGSGAQSKATYEGEVTVEPSALHSVLRVEGQAAAQLPGNQVEAIWIGDQVWVKVGRRPWVQVPASAVESQFSGQVLGVGDLLPFVQQARRIMPDETVSGIACKHYVYDVGNLQSEAGMTSARGEIWVAREGGYVVRLTLNGQGTYYGTYASSGTLRLLYELYDVNAPIQIAPPR